MERQTTRLVGMGAPAWPLFRAGQGLSRVVRPVQRYGVPTRLCGYRRERIELFRGIIQTGWTAYKLRQYTSACHLARSRFAKRDGAEWAVLHFCVGRRAGGGEIPFSSELACDRAELRTHGSTRQARCD